MSSDARPERIRLLLEECAELFTSISKIKPKNQDDRRDKMHHVVTTENITTIDDIPLPSHIANFLAEQLPQQTNVAELIQRLLGEDADATDLEEKKRRMIERLVEIIFNKLSKDTNMQKDFGATIANQLEIVNLFHVEK